MDHPLPQLRIGLLVDDEQLPAWAVDMLERLIAARDCNVVVVVRSAGERTQAAEDLGDWRRAGANWVWRAWLRMERWLYPSTAEIGRAHV